MRLNIANGIKFIAVNSLFSGIWLFRWGGVGMHRRHLRPLRRTLFAALGASAGIAACLLTTPAHAAQAPAATSVPAAAQSAGAQSAPQDHPATVTTRQRRLAEDAYLAGAKKLEHDDAEAAQQDFERAAQFDPGNAAYAAAITVVRERRLTELVRQAGEARKAGDESKAQTLLADARKIDPASPLVLEHAEPSLGAQAEKQPSVAAQIAAQGLGASSAGRSEAIADAAGPSWRVQVNAAGPVQLEPSPGPQSFDLSGDSTDVVRRVLQAYGIRAVIDDSVEHKNLRFHMDGVSYAQAVHALATMANIFLVPVDAATAIAAKDNQDARKRLERQLEETIYLPGIPTAQFNEIVQALKGLFDGLVLNPQQTLGAIVVRAPEDVLAAVNQTVQGLQETSGEVVVEVQLYEVDTTKTLNAGANIPTQFGIFNVDQAAAQLVSQNSSLVQQAIAQGLISSTASNFEIAAALIGSGLVQSSLLNSTIGVFGGGLTQTGITETGSLGINLGLNSTDTRTLDDAQLRVGDRETATFREGTRYPVTTSTLSTGLAGASSSLGSLGNATINGVSVSSLLSQASQTATTVPQITYEDLGITLEATPVIEKSGRINLKLDLKIAALTGDTVNNIPVLASRDFKSSLTVAEGQSALLSSMVTNSEISAMSGLPGISELPGFQLPVNDNVQKQTTQLVVVVTPHIVRRRSSLVAGPMIALPLTATRQ